MAVNFTNLPNNLFCGFNSCKFMHSAILYHNNLIFVEIIFANAQKIAKSVKFTALKNFGKNFNVIHECTCTMQIMILIHVYMYIIKSS